MSPRTRAILSPGWGELLRLENCPRYDRTGKIVAFHSFNVLHDAGGYLRPYKCGDRYYYIQHTADRGWHLVS